LVFVSFIPFVAGAIGWLLCLLILITNELVKWVEKIPYAYVEGIQISIPQSILLYLITAMFIGYMLMYHRVYLKLLLGFGLIYVAIFSYTKIKQANQQELTVYKVNNHFAMRILNGTKSYLFADDTLYADKDKMRFHLQQHFWNHGIKTEQVLSNLSQTHLIEVSGKHILLGGDMVVEKDIHALILTKYIEPEKIARINPEMIVIGSSLSVGKTNKLKMILEQMGFKVHAVRDSGAFQLSL
jgi:energy-coupling factor transporter transmembrane protein EcfT